MPVLEEDVKRIKHIRTLKRLSPQDWQHLIRCIKRDGSQLAMDVLGEKLIPPIRYKVNKHDKSHDDIASETKSSRSRPRGRRYELVNEAFCGRALPSDDNELIARGILGAINRYNENRGDFLTYIEKEVRGTTTDFAKVGMAEGSCLYARMRNADKPWEVLAEHRGKAPFDHRQEHELPLAA